MANKKISDLTPATISKLTDLKEILDPTLLPGSRTRSTTNLQDLTLYSGNLYNAIDSGQATGELALTNPMPSIVNYQFTGAAGSIKLASPLAWAPSYKGRIITIRNSAAIGGFDIVIKYQSGATILTALRAGEAVSLLIVNDGTADGVVKHFVVQDVSDVKILGGTIDGTIIGQNVSQPGYFNEVYITPPSGGVNSGNDTRKSFDLVTLNDTPTAIVSIPLSNNQRVIFEGKVIGGNISAGGTCGGRFEVVAHRPPASNVAIVGVVYTNQQDNTPGTGFTCDADIGTQSIRLMVTGELANPWAWVTSYSYQILTP